MDLDAAPSLPRFQPEDQDAILMGRRPSMGEYLGAAVGEGWWNSLPGLGIASGQAQVAGEVGEPMAREAWQASSYWRPGVSWDDRMTEARAQAIARVYDDNQYRRHLMNARDPGALEIALGFGGMLVGSIPDPVNFLPIAGPVGRVLRAGEAAFEGGMAARAMGRVAGALEQPGVAGGLARGAVEGFGGNAVAAPGIYTMQAGFGDEVTASRVVSDLAIGALIGAGFGGAGGLFERVRRGAEPVVAARILDAMSRDVAAGRQVEIPPGLARAAVEDAINRSAPASADPFLRALDDGNGRVRYSADLPSRNGQPLTRDEFAAELAARQGTTVERMQADVEAAAKRADSSAADASKAQTLVRWLIANGGVKNDGGDLMQALGGTARTRPGLINNKTGMAPDIAAIRARAAGFFDDFEVRTGAEGKGIEPDRLMPTDLYDAIDAELRGSGMRVKGSRGIEPMPERNAGDRVRQDHRADVDEAYAWYREALTLQDRLSRLSADVRDTIEERAAILEHDAGMTRERATIEAVRQAGDEADPDLAAIRAEIEQMRAEGRFTAADEAALKAGDEAAAQTEAIASGLEQAAVCMMGRLA